MASGLARVGYDLRRIADSKRDPTLLALKRRGIKLGPGEML
jgi:hypothetical protein